MLTWQQVVEIAVQFPGVTEAVSYGEPSLKVRTSLLTRWRMNDDSIVLLDVDSFERDHLMYEAADTYFLEDHYRAYNIVLAYLARLDPDQLTAFLERRWRNIAPKRVIKAFDQTG